MALCFSIVGLILGSFCRDYIREKIGIISIIMKEKVHERAFQKIFFFLHDLEYYLIHDR